MAVSSPPPAPERGRWHSTRWPGRLFDVGVVLGLLLVGAAILLASTNEFPRVGPARIPVLLLTGVALAALFVHRRWPVLTLAVVIGVVLAELFLRTPIIAQPLVLVGVYTVAARLPWRTSLPLTVASVAVLAAGMSVAREGPWFQELVSALVPISGAYVVGIYAGTRVNYIDSLRSRAAHVDRERELLAQKAVAEERVRIARELHDVVAHHLSLITVQAGALQANLPADHPAHKLAGSMAQSGREAMDEMRRMLGLLRLGSADGPDLSPQPGIDQVPALVEQARAAGLDVELAIDTDHPFIPAGVDLSAYRIVQEALTNVLRHAGSAHCRVRVGVYGNALELVVTDDGHNVVGTEPSAGHGLVGMRERVALFGGRLFTGPVPGGGFAVQATLPLHPHQGTGG